MWAWLYGKTRLPQVLRITPQDHHLLPGQPGAQHQLVEPVDLDPALPDRGHRIGESSCDVIEFTVGRGGDRSNRATRNW